MASPTVATHGKLIALYRLRPNGFKGVGLNDASWGLAATNAATAYYEVVIDSELGGTAGVDTCKWRKNGGAWTEDVDITGAEQTLDEGQKITFAATTGHTLTDQWVIGNLKDEATTESGADAQITDATHRMLNPNSPPTFTDDGGKHVLVQDFTRGKATFDGNVGNVDVDGNNGWVPAAALQVVGYLFGWSLNMSVEIAKIPEAGQDWLDKIVGHSDMNGSADTYFIGTETFKDMVDEMAASGDRWFLLQFFNYDPDQDQTGDHMIAWGTVAGLNVAAQVGVVVTEKVTFEVHDIPSFVANA